MAKPPHQDLQRRTAKIKPPLRIAIVCEGKVTEPTYLKQLINREKAHLACLIKGAGVPATVVRHAVDLNRKKEFEEIWCVFDVDDHPRVSAAVEQARAHQLNVAVSNPCFELWALLHFQDQTAEIGRKRLRKKLLAHLPNYEKVLPFDFIDHARADACMRARHLDTMHLRLGRTRANPSTGAYKLVSRIESLGREARIRAIERVSGH